MSFLKKTLIGSFRCVNTRVAFHSEILLPSFLPKDDNKLKIDERFKMRKRADLKVGYRLQLNNEETYND